MPEVLNQLAAPILSVDGQAYRSQVVGADMPDGRWEGWIEFIPLDGGQPVRTPRETTQPNRADTLYWASGLSATYMEGALARALNRPVVTSVPHGRPLFNEPAREFVISKGRPQPHVEAVLDPFSVYEKGEVLLRKELGALSSWHLVNIVLAYRLSDRSETELSTMSHADLVALITDGVREHAGTRSH